MAPHPTYTVLRGRSGYGIKETLYSGPSQEKAREIAQRQCGYGKKKPGKEPRFRYRYFTVIQVWSDGSLVAGKGYTRNGYLVEKEVGTGTRGLVSKRVVRDEDKRVSNQVGEI